MDKQDIKYFEFKKQCQFHEWYEKFKSVTFSSVIIPLPKIFIDYLNSEHFETPQEGFPEFQDDDDKDDFYDNDNWSKINRKENLDPKFYQINDDDDYQDSDSENTDDDIKINKRIIKESEFQDIVDKVQKSIDKFGGNVMPKLNWSAPKDATWMNVFNSLKCTTTTDVFLLLKSSSFINHDLSQFTINLEDKDDSITPYTLIIRKWQNLQPSMEFRCFVKNNQLLGISQRDTSTYFDFLKDKKQRIQDAIVKFYNQSIHEKFSHHSYTFDCYVTKEDQVWLIDFNPIHPSTEALLFVWDELIPELIEQDQNEQENEETKQANSELPIEPLKELEFRIINDVNSIKPNVTMTSRLPMDLMNMRTNDRDDNINDILDNFKKQTIINKK